jgi:BirA family transcriptional regulator, biotin operon repressor / biotin---[acetyl-CoA-carboxylase] ligase
VQFKKIGNIHIFSRLASTQDKAWELISAGAPSGTIVIAGVQTAGRGRRGNIWQSPPGGLWFSLALSSVSRLHPGEVTLSAAKALQAALKSSTSLEVRIKLPNDLYFQDKKIAGIILEVKGDTAVLGVGLNVNCLTGGWPAGISAFSLREAMGRKLSRWAILSAFLAYFKNEAVG